MTSAGSIARVKPKHGGPSAPATDTEGSNGDNTPSHPTTTPTAVLCLVLLDVLLRRRGVHVHARRVIITASGVRPRRSCMQQPTQLPARHWIGRETFWEVVRRRTHSSIGENLKTTQALPSRLLRVKSRVLHTGQHVINQHVSRLRYRVMLQHMPSICYTSPPLPSSST